MDGIPSKKAEPVKQWLASVGAERIHQMVDTERSIEQAVEDYRRLGYSEAWINQRIKTIEIRKHLTGERKRGGVKGLQQIHAYIFAGLTSPLPIMRCM